MVKNKCLGNSSAWGCGLHLICLVLSCHGLVHTHIAIFAKLRMKTEATGISYYRTPWQRLVNRTYWKDLPDSWMGGCLFITQVVTTETRMVYGYTIIIIVILIITIIIKQGEDYKKSLNDLELLAVMSL